MESKEESNLRLLDGFVHLKGDGRVVHQEVFNYLRQYLGNYEFAEDVLIEVQLQAHLKRDSYDSRRELRPWLFKIATNKARDYQKREKRWRRVNHIMPVDYKKSNEGELIIEPEDDYENPLDEMIRKEDGHEVRKCISRLSDKFRNSLMLVYFQGLKYEEAAEILSIPIGTVKCRVHRSLKKLEKILRAA